MSPLLTKRLILRDWREEDLPPFFELNSDPKVMEYFPKVLSREESDELAEEIRRRLRTFGWGFWAVEEKASGEFVGFVGLNRPQFSLPFTPCIEVGWRLLRRYWGKGYATEAGSKSLEFAFNQLQENEVLAFATAINLRSVAVMKRLGMANTNSNFMHPEILPESELSEHVLYKAVSSQWQRAHT